MKTCTRCNETKSLDLFAKNARKPQGRASWCKQCFADYDRERYQNGDNVRKKRNAAAFLAKNRKQLWELLCNSECLVCGDSDPEVLEFDHRDPKLKKFNVSGMLNSYSWVNILKEIEKCDILCVKCHRKKTIKQFGFWRSTMTL